MNIQFRVFRIPISNSEEAIEEMNSFLRGHRIVEITKQFIENEGNSFWTFCVEYLHGDESSGKSATAKTDYREILNESDFSIFAQLRTLRKEIAEKERLPGYVLFTNEQLARMVQNRATTEEAIAKIPGVGQARIKKYGEPFLRILREVFVNEENQRADGKNP
ncbi:MAG: HRDC domain-containing protein [bacterium]